MAGAERPVILQLEHVGAVRAGHHPAAARWRRTIGIG